MKTEVVRLTLLGVGAMNSSRYAPAGLLVEHGNQRVMIDGGPGAEPQGRLCTWLITDEQGELARQIRTLARTQGLEPRVASYRSPGLHIEPYPVVHTSHPAFGYLIRAARKRIVWAPEFFVFPNWTEKADLMFAEAAGWNRPIRFVGGVGGHAAALEVAGAAQARGVRRLVFAHIGRPTIRAIDAGQCPPFGEFGFDGAVYLLGGKGAIRTAKTRRR
jgi:Beta-lactamase superfamily domain